MAVDDIWQFTVRGIVHGQQHLHSLHFRESDEALTGDGLITAWSGAPMTAYRNCFHVAANAVALIQAKKVCAAGALPSPTEVVPLAAAQLGTRSTSGDDPMPAFLACLVSEKGVLAGRSNQGRFFLGGLFESDCIGDSLQSAYIARVQGYVDALKTLFVTPAAPPWQLWCYSQLLHEGDPTRTPPLAPSPCANSGSRTAQLTVSPRPTTMRSRKLGHGI